MQIPEDELLTMPTEKLIQAYIDCAFARNFFLHSSIESYYNELYNSFNGVRELMKREDAFEEIIKFYSSMDSQDSAISAAGLPMRFQIQFVEYLIGNPRLLEGSNHEQLLNLATELIKKSERRTAIQYAEDNLQSNTYALAQLLASPSSNRKNDLIQIDQIDFLLKTGRIPNEAITFQILNLAKDFASY